jgi:hypothetical protein
LSTIHFHIVGLSVQGMTMTHGTPTLRILASIEQGQILLPNIPWTNNSFEKAVGNAIKSLLKETSWYSPQVWVNGSPFTGVSLGVIAMIPEEMMNRVEKSLSWMSPEDLTDPKDRDVVSRVLKQLKHSCKHGLTYELLPLLNNAFTVTDFRRVREAVLGHELDPSNARKLVKRFEKDGLIVSLPEKRRTPTRPAQLYARTS